MTSFDFRHVEEARAAPSQASTGENQFSDRLVAALVQRPRSVSYSRRALEHGLDFRVGFEALELLERAQVGIAVIESNDEAHSDQRRRFIQVVQKRSAVRVFICKLILF